MGMSLGCDPNKDLDHQTNNGKSADSQAKLGGSAAFRHSASWGLIWQQRDPTLLALFASSACFSLALSSRWLASQRPRRWPPAALGSYRPRSRQARRDDESARGVRRLPPMGSDWPCSAHVTAPCPITVF